MSAEVRKASNEPLFLAFLYGFGERRVVDDDGCISTVRWLRPLGFVGVVGAFVTEHMADDEHHDAQQD